MKQLNNGYADFYYLLEDGKIYNAAADKLIEADKQHLFYLKTKDKGFKKVSLNTLYRALYNKKFCIDEIEDLNGEEWKEIDDTKHLYYISNQGRVKSYKGYNAMLLKPYKNQGGYDRVDIIIGGKRQSKLVHRLVAAAFMPMPEKIDYQLHHKDFNKNNSAAANLEWLSAAEHAKKHAERRIEANECAEPEEDNN